VVAEVCHVTLGDGPECRLLLPDDEAAARHLLGRAIEHMGKVPIESLPQGDEVTPAPIGIALRADPVLLRIGGEHERRVLLHANEAQLVVHGGVHEMAEDLAAAPTPAWSNVGRGLIGNATKARESLLHSLNQCSSNFACRHLTTFLPVSAVLRPSRFYQAFRAWPLCGRWRAGMLR